MICSILFLPKIHILKVLSLKFEVSYIDSRIQTCLRTDKTSQKNYLHIREPKPREKEILSIEDRGADISLI